MKKLFLFLGVASLLVSCSRDKNDMEVTAKTVENTPNVKEFKTLADAIDNLKVKSKEGIEEQLGNYLDKNGSKGMKIALKNATLAKKKSITAKGTNESEEAIDVDKNLSEAGFTDVQKEFVSKIMALYPLDNSEANKVSKDDINEDDIKEGLLRVRNEVFGDMRLNIAQKEQLYTYIDLQYATLSSIVNYTEKLFSATQQTGKIRFSFKKLINVVVSVVVTVAFEAILVSLRSPTTTAAIIGGAAGFLSGVISAVHNSCIKYCGTGYCDTAWNDCYTRRYLTTFILKND